MNLTRLKYLSGIIDEKEYITEMKKPSASTYAEVASKKREDYYRKVIMPLVDKLSELRSDLKKVDSLLVKNVDIPSQSELRKAYDDLQSQITNVEKEIHSKEEEGFEKLNFAKLASRMEAASSKIGRWIDKVSIDKKDPAIMLSKKNALRIQNHAKKLINGFKGLAKHGKDYLNSLENN